MDICNFHPFHFKLKNIETYGFYLPQLTKGHFELTDARF